MSEPSKEALELAEDWSANWPGSIRSLAECLDAFAAARVAEARAQERERAAQQCEALTKVDHYGKRIGGDDPVHALRDAAQCIRHPLPSALAEPQEQT